jgi:hypothetical protein
MTYNSKLNPQPPTAQTGEDYDGETGRADWDGWLMRAREAYHFSTSYVDQNYRKQWEDSIRAFNSMHPSDSKFSAESYQKRSHIYRPKIRTLIRKNEAAAAAAYFSNMDMASFKAVDESNKAEVASAEMMKQVMQYRLTKSIDWFKLVMGAIQDAQVNVAVAHIYWEYKEIEIASSEMTEEEKRAETSEEYPAQSTPPTGAETVEGTTEATEEAEEDHPKKSPGAARITSKARRHVIDKPVIDLVPIENLRIDPAASWMDPIGTSPYLIHLIPMYVMDVKDRIQAGEWMPVSLNQVRQAMATYQDSTRTARNKNRDDPQSSDNRPNVRDYEIVWVQRHIHRRFDIDWEFYMLGDVALLTEPKPLIESVFHGQRPYVMGSAVIETHKVMPSSIPTLARELATESNEITNQRIDNVKFVLNKKWFAKRGAEVDLGGLVRNVPGGVVLTDDPEKDIKEVNWPDVTSSAYEEQKRIDNDMNELLGNFSSASLLMDRNLNAPAHNMSILNNSTGTLTEYLLRTFNETFIQPVLRQLILLEQYYETDETVLAIAAKKAKLWQRFGINQVTDELLQKEMTMSINVGMGATDPQLKLQKFLVAMNTIIQMLQRPVPGVNMQEVMKEIFGYLGYDDASRFFTSDNPQVQVLMQQLQQAMGALNQLKMKAQDKTQGHMINLQKQREKNQTDVVRESMKQEGENRRNAMTHAHALREMSLAARTDIFKHLSTQSEKARNNNGRKAKQ